MRLFAWRSRSRDSELDEEIRSHMAMAIKDRVDRGEDPKEAEYAVRREFGNVGLVKEVTRAMWGSHWAEQLARDLRFALRMMLRAPGFTAVVVLTLALGIGANTAIFTVVHAALLQSLPYQDPDRLVVVWEQADRRPGRNNTVAPANFIQLKERSRAFERMAASYDYRVTLAGQGDPEELTAQAVTPDFFPMLGVPPQRGRVFTHEDAVRPEEKGEVVILSGELWRRRFASDPDIVGRTIRLAGSPVTVIGVMPAGTRFLAPSGSLVGKPPDVWYSFEFSEASRRPRGRFLTAYARLKADVPLAAAQTEMDTIMAALTKEWPDFDTGWHVKLVPLHREISGELRPALLVLTAAVGFVLLVACANVASLMLARGAARRREFAVRSALGAGRGRIARQLLAETSALAAAGGLLGLLFAWWGVRILTAISPVDLAHLGPLGLSLPVLGFTAAISVATAVLCGLAPLLDSARQDVQETLKDGARQSGSGRRATVVRNMFVVAEIALVVVLMIGAGLLVRSFANLRGADPGFNGHNVLTARVALPGAVYRQPASRVDFFRRAVGRVSALPGVRAAGVSSFLPFAGLGAATNFDVEGRPPAPAGQAHVADVRVCDNGYFKAMRIPLLKGRLFDERELREAGKVVIINETLAREHFAGEDPIGKRLLIVMMDPVVPTTIIGVVGSVRETDLSLEIRPAAYWPLGLIPYTAMSLVVRSDVEPQSLAGSVAREVRALDRDQPISDVRTMEEWIGRSTARTKFSGTVLTMFAAFALFLAALGVYGVMSYSVSQRTNELGVRIALGAAPRAIVAMVLTGAFRLTVVGTAAGALLAVGLTRYLGALLYETKPLDGPSFAAAVGLLAAVALFAAWLPARHAARVDPVETLRN